MLKEKTVKETKPSRLPNKPPEVVSAGVGTLKIGEEGILELDLGRVEVGKEILIPLELKDPEGDPITVSVLREGIYALSLSSGLIS